MKQLLLITTTAILIAVAFWIGVRSRPPRPGPATPSKSFERQEHPAPLTDAEERELRWRIAATLRWILTWQNKISNCPTGKGVETLDLLSIYQQHAGQDIEMGVTRSKNNVAVSLDALQINLGFRRLNESGLGPASLGYFCENSFAGHIAAVQTRAAGTRTEGERAMAAARSDSQVGPVLSEMEKKQPNGELKENEMRGYALPPLSDLLQQSSPSTQEQEALYEAILTVIRGEVETIDCNHGPIAVTVPTFDVGDRRYTFWFKRQTLMALT